MNDVLLIALLVVLGMAGSFALGRRRRQSRFRFRHKPGPHPATLRSWRRRKLGRNHD